MNINHISTKGWTHLDVSPNSKSHQFSILTAGHRLKWRLPKYLFLINRYFIPSLMMYAMRVIYQSTCHLSFNFTAWSPSVKPSTSFLSCILKCDVYSQSGISFITSRKLEWALNMTLSLIPKLSCASGRTIPMTPLTIQYSCNFLIHLDPWWTHAGTLMENDWLIIL